MANRFIDRLLNTSKKSKGKSFIRNILSGRMYKISDLRSSESVSTIKNIIDTMRALANDSQISTALSYYATDSTTANSQGQIIWATSDDKNVAAVVNQLFERWNINAYARDHILELATIGNLYIPTTQMYRQPANSNRKEGVSLNNNTIADDDFDIVPSHKIVPEDIVHVWYQGKPSGYIHQPSADSQNINLYSESAVIHFSLGGLLGDYTIDTIDADRNPKTYDIMFAEPLMSSAISPTQTLSLLEDAMILSSLVRIVRFINVDCSDAEEEEISGVLQDIKDAIEQQLSINTLNGDTQSYVNPQSPNNLIYLPKVNGQDAVSITDLNMADTSEADNKLLTHFQNKKLSVLGVPKEALNFSSNEGLGGAGSVMSQRSSLYANILNRLETAYMSGWKQALNTYFTERGFSGYVNKFQLHMNPIITQQSTIQFEKRDAALSQATALVQLLKDAGVDDRGSYRAGLVEILSEVFPKMGTEASSWKINIDEAQGGGSGDEF